jgi:hypothetical protein
MACVLALATGTGLALGTAARPALASPDTATAASKWQLNIVTQSATSDDATVNLDVKFRGGTLRSIELYVDGTLIKQQTLRTRSGHGTVRFALDSALLANGSHDIKVVAIDGDGNTATATSQWTLVSGDLNDIVRFLYPKSREMVQGVVPIEIKLDDSLHKPYVMFFVDNEFLALINYAPYTYNWDSTHASNGPHTLGVEAYDGDTLAKVRARSMSITVNNPGGLTARQEVTPDLNRGGGLSDPTARLLGKSSPPNGAPSVKGDGNGPLIMPMLPSNPVGAPDSRPPSTYPTRSLPHIGDIHRPTISHSTSHATAPGLMALLAGPRDLAFSNVLTMGTLAHQPVQPLRAGNIAARPSQTLGATPRIAPNGHGKVATQGRGTASALVGPGALPSLPGSAFDVAFDNTRIAFDVPPRVEHGMPLAPFRQIFEHTGGTLQWFGKSKLVRAVNATREIELKIGNPQATVNNQPVQMEAKPYIDRGRTIVPLSFVRDALNVKVQYDPQTGRMLIESQK